MLINCDCSQTFHIVLCPILFETTRTGIELSATFKKLITVKLERSVKLNSTLTLLWCSNKFVFQGIARFDYEKSSDLKSSSVISIISPLELIFGFISIM